MPNDIFIWFGLLVSLLICLRVINSCMGYGRQPEKIEAEAPKPTPVPTPREQYVDDLIHMDVDDYMAKWADKEIPKKESKPPTAMPRQQDENGQNGDPYIQHLMAAHAVPEVSQVVELGGDIKGHVFVTNHGPGEAVLVMDGSSTRINLQPYAAAQVPNSCRNITISTTTEDCSLTLTSGGISLQQDNSGGLS